MGIGKQLEKVLLKGLAKEQKKDMKEKGTIIDDQKYDSIKRERYINDQEEGLTEEQIKDMKEKSTIIDQQVSLSDSRERQINRWENSGHRGRLESDGRFVRGEIDGHKIELQLPNAGTFLQCFIDGQFVTNPEDAEKIYTKYKDLFIDIPYENKNEFWANERISSYANKQKEEKEKSKEMTAQRNTIDSLLS
ncbi:MAG: hypothetical protein NTW06_04515 [Candidatus Falkowbacteria bacterium]|nr:hypothetical protein [Candidatus Falkowbacteria bacterium]